MRKALTRKALAFGLLVLFAGCTVASASNWTTTYRDIRRTGGHARSAAAFAADMRFCAAQTGLPFNNRANDLAIDQPDPPAFKACMLGRGLKWRSTVRNYHQHAPAQARGWSSGNDDTPWVDNSVTPTPLVDIPPIQEPTSPPLSIYDPQVNPGVFEHRDDPQVN